jgi:MbtH protein
MADQENDPFSMYFVVVNDEEQYSIWPSVKPMPFGWRSVGPERSKEQCLAHIEEVWTDMRPLSLRRAMDEARRETAEGVADDAP